MNWKKETRKRMLNRHWRTKKRYSATTKRESTSQASTDIARIQGLEDAIREKNEEIKQLSDWLVEARVCHAIIGNVSG